MKNRNLKNKRNRLVLFYRSIKRSNFGHNLLESHDDRTKTSMPQKDIQKECLKCLIEISLVQ